MTEHELKCRPECFRFVRWGDKRFEARKNDRGFQRLDTLWLREWSPETKEYTGNELKATVTYILTGEQFGVQPGWCVMSILPVFYRDVTI